MGYVYLDVPRKRRSFRGHRFHRMYHTGPSRNYTVGRTHCVCWDVSGKRRAWLCAVVFCSLLWSQIRPIVALLLCVDTLNSRGVVTLLSVWTAYLYISARWTCMYRRRWVLVDTRGIARLTSLPAHACQWRTPYFTFLLPKFDCHGSLKARGQKLNNEEAAPLLFYVIVLHAV